MVLVVLLAEGAAAAEEVLDDVAVAAVDGVEEGRVADDVSLGGGGALLQEEVDDVEGAAPARVVQGVALALRVAVAVGDLRAVAHEQPHHLEVAFEKNHKGRC